LARLQHHGKLARFSVSCSWFPDAAAIAFGEAGMDNASFLSLTPSEPIATSTPMFDPQPVPRSPLVAFLLSLVLPGAGQIYCGKTSRGLWTLAIFLPALVLTVYLTLQLGGAEGKVDAFFWGILLRITLFLYVFAFLDAFFTAREMTAGTDAFIAESPRVAAILNLLTRGFGYFYLGQRKLGLTVFFGLMFFQAPLAKTAVGALILEFISAAMGVHAYSIARRSEKEILTTVRLPAGPAPSAGVPRAIPVGLAVVLAAGYLALLVLGLLLPDYSHVDQSTARVSPDSHGVIYQNPAYEVSLLAPASWTVTNDEPTYLLLAVRSDRACSASLQPIAWSPLIGLGSFRGQLSYQLSKRKDMTGEILDEQPVVLSSLPARDIHVSIQQGTRRLIEHHLIAKKGMTLYDLSTDELADDEGNAAEPTCSSEFSLIRKNLVLPH
jgi:TM2 domain-containing membrane protein YozV